MTVHLLTQFSIITPCSLMSSMRSSIKTWFRACLFHPFFSVKKISLERFGPLLQSSHVGSCHFLPHLLTKRENKTTFLEFTEITFAVLGVHIHIEFVAHSIKRLLATEIRLFTQNYAISSNAFISRSLSKGFLTEIRT